MTSVRVSTAAAFVRQARARDRCDVEWVRGADSLDASASDFASAVAGLSQRLDPLPIRQSIRLAWHWTTLLANQTPFERPGRSSSVGKHHLKSSTDPRRGRILAQLVAARRARHAVEIGTAYGMGTLYMLAGGPPDMTITTLECSSPQFEIAKETFSRTRVAHRMRQVRADPARIRTSDFANAPPIDFFFHDGGHFGEKYVADFLEVLPRLSNRAWVLFDDIRWNDSSADADPQTYEGWTEVVQHEGVVAGVEIDGEYGLALVD